MQIKTLFLIKTAQVTTEMKNQDFLYNSLPKVKDCNFILQLKNLKEVSLKNSDLYPFPFPCSKELKIWQPAALLPEATSAQQFRNIRLRKIPQVSKKIDFQIQYSLSSSKKELPHQLTGCLQICSPFYIPQLCAYLQSSGLIGNTFPDCVVIRVPSRSNPATWMKKHQKSLTSTLTNHP